MKKTTKLLTAVALILGASAFVSCSSGDDVPADTRSAEQKAYDAKVAEAKSFLASHSAFEVPNDKKEDLLITSVAKKYNDTFAKLENTISEKAADIANLRKSIASLKVNVGFGKCVFSTHWDVDETVEILNKGVDDKYKVNKSEKLVYYTDFGPREFRYYFNPSRPDWVWGDGWENFFNNLSLTNVNTGPSWFDVWIYDNFKYPLVMLFRLYIEKLEKKLPQLYNTATEQIDTVIKEAKEARDAVKDDGLKPKNE